jgi:geranylgeranyl pyrophosphate synthase
MTSAKGERTSQALLEILKKRSKKCLELARRLILIEKTGSEKTRKALEYYTSNWEIFIHPSLFSISYETLGGNPDDVLQFQAALSMLAAAFDIHDDVIDNSKIKRGKQTVLGKFGKDMAILLGDAFLVRGFTLLFESMTGVYQEKAKNILETLQKSLFELGNAHVRDLDLKGRMDIGSEEYMEVMRMKAASIEADMKIGAILGGGSGNEVQALERFGKNFGILATLREEFIDMYEPEELGQRLENEYLPIPMLCALQNAKMRKTIQSKFSQGDITLGNLEHVAHLTLGTIEVKKLKIYMQRLINDAVSSVSIFKDSNAKVSLEKLANSMLEDI